jgi:hypothetical protein
MYLLKSLLLDVVLMANEFLILFTYSLLKLLFKIYLNAKLKSNK